MGLCLAACIQIHNIKSDYSLLLRHANLYVVRALMNMYDAGACLEQRCPVQVERTRMTVFSSTAEHFERLSSGLIPAVDLRLFWVCTLSVYTPLQHKICISLRLRTKRKLFNFLVAVTARYNDAEGSVCDRAKRA